MDYPKWLAYAAGNLEDQGHVVRLLDAPARGLSLKEVEDDCKAFAPEMIVAECNFSSMDNDLSVLTGLGASTGAITVMTGPPASRYSERMIRNGADIVAEMEYDITLSDLAAALASGRGLASVKGLSFSEDGKIYHNEQRDPTTEQELDRMHFVSKTYKKHLHIEDYSLSQSLFPEIQIFAGRGCPNLCTFCSWPENFTGRKLRMRSVGNLADEFQYVAENLPEIREIFIEDDSFTIKKGYVEEFCAELLRRKIKITWSCNSRATLDYETMRIMRSAGCRLLIVGFESGNDEILKGIKKGITTERMIRFANDAHKARMMVHGDFIIGLPGETEQTARQTLDFIKAIRPNVLQVAVATPIPGTVFYDQVRDAGYCLVDDIQQSIDSQGFQKCIVSYPELSSAQIEHYVQTALKEFYLSPSFIPIFLSNILRRNGVEELRIMLRSARSFLKYMGAESNGQKDSGEPGQLPHC
jgi:anaerobic magnesium-protoporphyrin IX monomethyl ester cyclase